MTGRHEILSDLKRRGTLGEPPSRARLPESIHQHVSIFRTLLLEIPPDFLRVSQSSAKLREVTDHLSILYGKKPTTEHAKQVLSRVVCLARFARSGRSGVENRTAQISFKVSVFVNGTTRCAVCGYLFRGLQDVTVDHVIPLALGGGDQESNWELLCSNCNSEKGNAIGAMGLAGPLSYISNQFWAATQEVAEASKHLPKSYAYMTIERDGRACVTCGKNSTAVELSAYWLHRQNLAMCDGFATFCGRCARTDLNNTHPLRERKK